MTENEAFDLLKSAIEEVVGEVPDDLSMDTDMIEEEIVDSLDSMNVLFEVETKLGKKVPAFDEDYDDFKIGAMVKHICAAA